MTGSRSSAVRSHSCRRTPSVVVSREEQLLERLAPVAGCEGGDQQPGRPFFICTGVKKTSSAPAVSSASSKRAVELGRRVVHLGLEDQHALARRRGFLPDDEAQDVRPARRVAAAGAVATPSIRSGAAARTQTRSW